MTTQLRSFSGLASEARYGATGQGFTLYTISIARQSLGAAVKGFDAWGWQETHATPPLLRALIRCADALRSAGATLPQHAAQQIRNHLFDLVCMIVGPTRDARAIASRRGLRQARLTFIRDYIQHSFESPEVSCSHVAHYLGTTERYVQQLLEESGTTFTELVLQHRLTAAVARLTHPTLHAMSNADSTRRRASIGTARTSCRTARHRWGLPNRSHSCVATGWAHTIAKAGAWAE